MCIRYQLVAPFILLVLLFTAASEPAVAAEKQKIHIIPVSGQVDYGMAAYIERNLKQHAGNSNDLVILEMDTFGGRVDSALEIVSHLTTIPRARVVSFVTKRAISAGALIALAANDLVMKDSTMIGDCAPIVMSKEGPKMLGEKMQSPLRAKFRALAKRNGYPELLSESMVSIDMEVYEVNFPDGKRYMDAVDFADLTDAEKKSIISRKTLVAKGELLTMDNLEAKELGFSRMTVADVETLLSAWGISDYELVRVQESWSEAFVRTVGSIAQILMLIGLGALYLEYKSPGFGIFGIVGICCLALVFFNQYLVGLADYTELLILIIGILLLAVEVFVLPGFGIAGVTGLFTIGISLILMMQDFVIPDPDLPWEQDLMISNLVQVLASFLGAFILTMLVFRFVLPRLSLTGRGPYLRTDLKSSHITRAEEKGVHPGDSGIAATYLRPSGKITIGGKRLDVVTAGEYIEKGRAVQVVKVDGNRIIVTSKS